MKKLTSAFAFVRTLYPAPCTLLLGTFLLLTGCSTSTVSTKETSEEIVYTVPESDYVQVFEIPDKKEPVKIEDEKSVLTVQPDGSFQAEIKDEKTKINTKINYKPAAPNLPGKLEVETVQKARPVKAVKNTKITDTEKKTESAGDWFKDVFKSMLVWTVIAILCIAFLLALIKKFFPGLKL